MTIQDVSHAEPAQAVHQDTPAEQTALGAMMLDPATIDPIATVVTPADFYDIRHSVVFQAIQAVHKTRGVAEPTMVASHLADVGDLARVGGAAYLTDCIRLVIDPRSGIGYAKRVRECADRRRLAEFAAAASRVTSTTMAAADAHARLADMVAKAAPRTDDPVEFADVADMVGAELDAIEAGPQNSDRIIRTGLHDLDKIVAIEPQELVVVGARPGSGKSTLCVDVARHAAYRQGLAVGIVSLEMSRTQLFRRILSAESGVPHDRIKSGQLDDQDWSKVARATGVMGDGRVMISDCKFMNLPAVAAVADKMRKHRGLDLLIVDYIQLIKGERKANESRQQEIGGITRGLKALAGELDVPILAAAQLNRGPESRADKRPQMSDLREAGDIENDADTVILIHLWAKADPNSPRVGEADLIVDKNRSGAEGVVPVAAQLFRCRFASMSND